jgi:outer membrane receptor protein involved in Fe transport
MKKKFILLLLLSYFTTHIFAQKKNIKGVVLDQETGVPIAFARVELTNFSPIKTAMANEKGKFEFAFLNEGKHRVKVSALEYDTYSEGWDTKSEFWELKINKSLLAPQNETAEKRFSTPVFTASNNFEKLSEAPATVHIITAEDIASRGYQYLTEALDDLPDIEINYRSDQGTVSFITIRGIAGGDKVLILKDGMRVNSAASSPTFLDKNFPIRFVKRIEVLLGGASALYGADAVSGVVNIITDEGRNLNTIKVQSGFGLYQTTDNFIQGGFGNRNYSVALSGSFFHSKEPFLPRYYPQEFDWYSNHYSLYGSMRTFSPDTAIVAIRPFYNEKTASSIQGQIDIKNFEFSFYHNNQTIPAAMGESPDFNLYASDVVLSRSINNAQISHKLKSKALNRWNLSSAIHFNRASYDNSSKFVNVFSNYGAAYKYSFNQNIRWLENFNFNLNPKHRFSAGTLLQYTYALPQTSDLPFKYDIFKSASAQNFYYLGTNQVSSTGESLAILQDFYFLRQFIGGTYIQYQGNIDDKLFVTAGGRLDYGQRQLIANTSENFNFLTFNPRVGLVYKANENFSAKLFYSESFLANSPEKLYAHFGSFVPLSDSVGNFSGYTSFFFRLPSPNIQPEKFRALETNLTYAKKSISLTSSAYYNRSANLLSEKYKSNVVFQNINIQTISVAENNTAFYAYGFSLKADYKKSFGLHKDKTLTIFGSYNYSDGRINDSLFLFMNALHHFKFGATWQRTRWSLHLRALYRSGTYNEDQFQTPSFLIFNSFLNVRVIQPIIRKYSLDLFIKAENLTNRRYYNAVIGAAIINQSPQNPIFLSFGASVQFHTAKSIKNNKPQK